MLVFVQTTNAQNVPDIWAPGEKMVTTSSESRNGYARASGTALASAVVAGVFALTWSQQRTISLNERELQHPNNPALGSIPPHCPRLSIFYKPLK
jgi:hypothetical protein